MGSVKKLIDLENGIISRDIFVNSEIYEQEQERIFARAWLFVGHETQIPNPGDFVVSRMGEESVILTRDMQDKIHVLLNTCRHRGMKVCRYDEGNTNAFVCPFHGWTYSINGLVVEIPGGLSGVPHDQAVHRGKLDKSQWGLIHVAQLCNYKGSVWATWDPSAPPFLDYLGDMRLWLDSMLDARDGRAGGSEIIPGIQKWQFASNWKFATENFIGDMYHGPITHSSVEAVAIGPGGKGQTRHGVERDSPALAQRSGITSFVHLGHGARAMPTYDEPPLREFGNPAVDEYFKSVSKKREQRLQGLLRAGGSGGSVFPNMSFHNGFPRTILVTHPLGPMRTEAWRWYLVDKDAPREVKELLRRFYMRYAGPAGMTEQDDMENWTYASEASKGVIARRYPYNYQQGLGLVKPAEGLRGAVVTQGLYSEENARNFYKRWAELMEAKSWDRLSSNDGASRPKRPAP